MCTFYKFLQNCHTALKVLPSKFAGVCVALHSSSTVWTFDVFKVFQRYTQFYIALHVVVLDLEPKKSKQTKKICLLYYPAIW